MYPIHLLHIRSASHSLRYFVTLLRYDPPIPTTTRLYHPEIRLLRIRPRLRSLLLRHLQTRPHKIARTHRQPNEKSPLGNHKPSNRGNRGGHHVLRTKRILRIVPNELSKNTGLRDKPQPRRENNVV